MINTIPIRYFTTYGLLLCIAMVTLSPAQAASKEICVHGNSAQIQTPGVEAAPLGGGLMYTVFATGSWLQYSIPSDAVTDIKGILIDFSNNKSEFGWIKSVHVYNGHYLVQKFDGLKLGHGKGGPSRTAPFLKLSKPSKFNRGIGISILPETGPLVQGIGYPRVKMHFHGVCAIPV